MLHKLLLEYSKSSSVFWELSENFFPKYCQSVDIESVGVEPLDREAVCITFANVSSAKAGHVAKRRGRQCQSSDCAMGGLPGRAYSVIRKLS